MCLPLLHYSEVQAKHNLQGKMPVLDHLQTKRAGGSTFQATFQAAEVLTCRMSSARQLEGQRPGLNPDSAINNYVISRFYLRREEKQYFNVSYAICPESHHFLLTIKL